MRVVATAATVVFLASALSASDPAGAGSRFSIDAELRPLAVSACGRYALAAEARFAPGATSADGRYALKTVHTPAGGCDPFPDPLFSDGFEAP